MTHVLAIIGLALLIFQIGCVVGVEKDTRPMTAPRFAAIVAGIWFTGIAVYLMLSVAL